MLIYSLSDSSHSSEEHLKSLVVTNFFSFLMYLNSPKNTCRLRTESNLYYRPTNIIRACFRYFPNMKICSLIIERPYFAFQTFSIVDGFAIKFLLKLLLTSQFKVLSFSFAIITCYIGARFWKDYTLA